MAVLSFIDSPPICCAKQYKSRIENRATITTGTRIKSLLSNLSRDIIGTSSTRNFWTVIGRWCPSWQCLMHRDQSNAESDLPLHATRQIDALCDEFEAAIKVHPGTQLMPYLDRIDPKWRRALLEELTVLAVDGLRNSGASNPKEQLLANNSDLRDELTALIAWDGAGTRTELHDRTIGKATGLTIRCPHCQHAIELIVDALGRD